MSNRTAPTKGGWRFVFEITEDHRKSLQSAGYEHEELDQWIGQIVFDNLVESIYHPSTEYEVDKDARFMDENGKFDDAKFNESSIIYSLVDSDENATIIEESMIKFPDIDWGNPEGIGKWKKQD